MNEEEVDEQFSSLKIAVVHHQRNSDNGTTEFGLRNASFVWNSVVEYDVEEPNDIRTVEDRNQHYTGDVTGGEGVSTSNLSLVAGGTTYNEGKRFELRNLNITFPPGKLTVVTGPTASGKSALLVGD